MSSHYPITGILKNGNRILLNNFYHVNFIAKADRSKIIRYDLENDIVQVTSSPFLTTDIKLKNAMDNGDIIGIYLDGIYEGLPVKNKTVIDVGANIGDSSIYFAMKGARKVIALEPFPKSYAMAKMNIGLNNVKDTIELLLAGCSNRNDSVIIDPNLVSSAESKMTRSTHGVEVPLLTLNKIVDDYGVHENPILKIDCEGCEYEIILSTPAEILQRFSHIFLEYHYGYKDLRKKLEESGFKVHITRPSIAGQLPLLFHLLRKNMIKHGAKPGIVCTKDDSNSSDFHDDEQYRLTCVGQIHAIRM